MPTSDLTVAELERILDMKRRRLADLQRKRGQIERRLENVTGKISRIEGGRGPSRPRAGRSSSNGHETTSAPAKRAKNTRPLREVVIDVLSQHKVGLTIADLAGAVLATGYQTTSTNFKNTLYQTLYHHDEFQLDKETGLYSVGTAGKSK